MAELFAYLFFFFMGFAAGAAAFMSYGLHQVNKMKKAKQTLLDEVKKKSLEIEQKTNSIKERLVKASQISQTQMEIRAQAEFPSKNGLHSKHKNDSITEIHRLEQEKIDLLKTIITDGFNPMITVVLDNGSKEEIPLSDYIDSAQLGMESATGTKSETPTTPVPTDPNEPRKIGKFFVYKGGKDTVH